MTQIGQAKVYDTLDNLNIKYEYFEHPPLFTIEEAIKHKSWMDCGFCKNLFFRNHKGNRHYLVVFEHQYQLSIHELEQKLKQGKLTFASETRMEKYLGLKPGSVSPFGLVNDFDNHVHVFFDCGLKNQKKWSFHPNDNRATLVVTQDDFMKFMKFSGNSWEFIDICNG